MEKRGKIWKTHTGLKVCVMKTKGSINSYSHCHAEMAKNFAVGLDGQEGSKSPGKVREVGGFLSEFPVPCVKFSKSSDPEV